MFPVQYTLLGVPFHKVDRRNIVSTFEQMLMEDRFHMIATPNPEFMLVVMDSPYYRQVLASSDLNIVDGYGLLWASTFWEESKKTGSLFPLIIKALQLYAYQLVAKKRLERYLPGTVLGSDTFFDVHPVLARRGTKVFYFGGAEEGLAADTMEEMKRRHPGLQAVGACGGFPYRSQEENQEILDKICAARPEVLFVALQFPKQEMWMYEHREVLEKAGVRIAMGVGGTFNFALGRIKRAPMFLRNIHMEWLWRLLKEPSRYKRILRAVLYFPYRMVQERWKKKTIF